MFLIIPLNLNSFILIRRLFFCFPRVSVSLYLIAYFKLNPSKLEKNEDVNLNLAHLLNILSELVEKIFMAAEILPP